LDLGSGLFVVNEKSGHDAGGSATCREALRSNFYCGDNGDVGRRSNHGRVVFARVEMGRSVAGTAVPLFGGYFWGCRCCSLEFWMVNEGKGFVEGMSDEEDGEERIGLETDGLVDDRVGPV